MKIEVMMKGNRGTRIVEGLQANNRMDAFEEDVTGLCQSRIASCLQFELLHRKA